MTCHKKANMKVPSYEPSWPNTVGKSSAVDCKVMQLHASPVKEPIVFKAPLPTVDVTTVHSQNDYTRAVHNKENAVSRDHDKTLDQGLEDSGYLSLHNSRIEEEDDKHVTPKPSPIKCQETNTSQSLFTPTDFHKKRNVTCSMSSTPADHLHNSKLPILNFNQVVCEKLSKSFQKNKRYDWSIISKVAEDHNLDRVIGGHMGVDHIDMFSSLLSRNMRCILAQILALLGDMDLISCRKVSKTWRKIIHEDSTALKRCQQLEKESELSQRLASGLTRDVGVSRVVLSSMQRLASSSSSSQLSPAPLQSFRNKGNSSSNAQTPNCTRFSQYVEAASTLKQYESLRPCKRCGSPATHSRVAQRATCTRSSCLFDFCTGCQEAFHGSTPCRVVQPRSHTSKSSTLLPGSARSKRNVRRL
ncbi:F-box only protein 5 [Boleophthalmus pectinirostris]|uniref:F-box only protein 5 n=1 Tax=Boleophthalmus pectinirostris TaxID=150288 RepID=UPI000A1C52EA|nr:F-box only protein 5 [Boleophthalmus pectinirostris]